MKRNFGKMLFMGAIVAMGFGLVSCASNKGEDKRLYIEQANEDEIDRVEAVDWTDRTLGVDSAPTWLKDLRRGNADTFKQQWGLDANRVVKIGMGSGKTKDIAQANSRAGFAYTQAAELTQKVIGRVGQGLNDMGQLEAIYIAASETKAEMSGLREETGFYQKIRTTKAGTKESTDSYVYYTVYSMDKSTWENLVRKYLMDLMGGANLETETQKKIGALFSEMKEDADKKDAKKAAEEEILYKAQLARLEAETAKAVVEAKKLDAKEAETKAAAEEAARLASYLM